MLTLYLTLCTATVDHVVPVHYTRRLANDSGITGAEYALPYLGIMAFSSLIFRKRDYALYREGPS